MPYIGRPLQAGVRRRYIYAATAGQTSFSGNDSSGISLAYDDNLFLDVYQNGVLLKPVTDYAATTGTSVVLTTGASTDDVLEMLVFDTFGVADTVSAKDGGSFAGAVSMASTLAVTGTTTIGNGTSGVAKINGGSSSSGQLIFMDAGTNRARIGVPTGTTTLSLSGSNTLTGDVVITADGEVTMPTQPAFLGKVASQISNLSIGGASNTDIPFNTEVFDQGGNFASSVFTAPITGRYQLSLDMRLDAVDSGTTDYHFYLITSNRTISFSFSPRFSADANFFPVVLSSLMDMDASDTAKIQYYITGGAAQTNIAVNSYFSGFLAC